MKKNVDLFLQTQNPEEWTKAIGKKMKPDHLLTVVKLSKLTNPNQKQSDQGQSNRRQPQNQENKIPKRLRRKLNPSLPTPQPELRPS